MQTLHSYVNAKLTRYATANVTTTKQNSIAYGIVTITVLCYLIHWSGLSGPIYSNVYWISNNALGYTLLIKLISSVQIGKVHLILLLYTLMIMYDCFFVFKTDVMVAVATRIENPMKFIIPD